MDKAEYRAKNEAAERKRQEAAENAYRNEVISALQRISEQNKAAENQAKRADRFHRLVDKLTLRLERRKYRIEIAETIGLWVAAGVGVLAIVVSNHDSGIQTKVMQDQQTAMQGQLNEMKSTGAQTDQIIETNRKLAEAAARQAEAAVDTVKTAQANMVASQRAWVGPRNARTDSALELGKDLTVFVDYQNSGREPAVEAIFETDLFVVSDEEDRAGKTHSRVMGFINKCKIKWAPTNAQVIFPTTGGFGGQGYVLNRKLLGEEIDQDVIDGTKSIVISGCFIYKTVGAIHRSAFCNYFNSKKSKPATWNICDFGNEAD